MKKLIFTLTVLAAVVLLSCNQAVKNNTDMKFTVIDSLISRQVENSNLGIVFSPPANWRPDNSNITAIQNQFASLPVFRDIVVEDIFVDRANMALMIISDISGIHDSILNAIIQNPNTFFADTSGNTTVITDKYSYNNLEVNQVLIQNPQFVNFKLFYLKGAGKAFEVDFISPKNTYNNVVKSIESSLGTFKPQ